MSQKRRADLPGHVEAHQVLVGYWIKVLGAALADEDGIALEKVAREVAGPSIQVKITTPLIPAEALALRQGLERMERHRVAEIGLNLVACCLLVRWLAQASGWTHSEILGRLRAELSGLHLPPAARCHGA